MSPDLAPFVAHLNQADLAKCSADAQPLLVEWWNVSRRQKHGNHAAWSERAWQLTINRVALLPAWQQLALAEAGIEHGWQTLKPQYIRDVKPPTGSALAPQSTAMQEAIKAWNNRAA
jgi:hypothetical protein